MIKNSCKEVKECCKCRCNIYTTEPRFNFKHGKCRHLKGQCTEKKPKKFNLAIGVFKFVFVAILSFFGVILAYDFLFLGSFTGSYL